MKPRPSLRKSPTKTPAEQVVEDIRQQTRRHFSAEDKIRIMLDAHVATLMTTRPHFADDETVPDHVREHLLRDVGPAAATAGGDMLLTASLTSVLSRQMAEEVEQSPAS